MMGLGADFIRAPGGRLLIVSTSGVLERPRGLVLSVSLPDRVWVTGIGGRLPLRLSRRLSTVTTPSARLLRFEGEAQNCSRRIFEAHTLQTVVNRLPQDHRLAAPTRRAKKTALRRSPAVQTQHFSAAATAKLQRSWAPDTSSAALPLRRRQPDEAKPR